ncbi:hypothetical protein HMP09_3387 [Sphingomonas sp. HMP9]|nr:hypothetical protein HMP09_3387 [Sphingomonas sp. HMP9]
MRLAGAAPRETPALAEVTGRNGLDERFFENRSGTALSIDRATHAGPPVILTKVRTQGYER